MSTQTDLADFGDPLQATSYALCIYDRADVVTTLAMSAVLPAGGMCGKSACWRGNALGFVYRNSARTPDGLLRMRLQSSSRPKTLITVTGSGANLKMPIAASLTQLFNDNPMVAVQLIQSNQGHCWEAVYPVPAVRNSNLKFTDVLP